MSVSKHTLSEPGHPLVPGIEQPSMVSPRYSSSVSAFSSIEPGGQNTSNPAQSANTKHMNSSSSTSHSYFLANNKPPTKSHVAVVMHTPYPSMTYNQSAIQPRNNLNCSNNNKHYSNVNAFNIHNKPSSQSQITNLFQFQSFRFPLKLKYHKKATTKDSDIQSELSSNYSFSRRNIKFNKKNTRYIVTIVCWIKYVSGIICEILRFCVDFVVTSYHRLQKWQKELSEAPVETKEKYFFLFSTILSTFLFYILFSYLDFMITEWLVLPEFITRYSFSISYVISYLSSVVWQHFFNQYFVFYYKYRAATSTTNGAGPSIDDTFCDSLLRTYLVYAFSLFVTGVFGSCVQIFTGIGDQFVLFITLPISGIMNYYLLRFFHNKQYKHEPAMNTNTPVSASETYSLLKKTLATTLNETTSSSSNMNLGLGSPSKSDDRLLRKFLPNIISNSKNPIADIIIV